MKKIRYNTILYFISAVILATLCIQLYWNYKNYENSKQQLLNDVQTSLDNAVDTYYTQLATQNSFGFTSDHQGFDPNRIFTSQGDSIELIIGDSIKDFSFISNNKESLPKMLSMMRSTTKDSVNNKYKRDSIHIKTINRSHDTIIGPIHTLTSKIIVSFSEDALSLSQIDSLFKIELARKNLYLEYGLSHNSKFQKKKELRSAIIKKSSLKTTSDSPYFFKQDILKAHFVNITLAVLKRNLIGMVLSFLLVGSVIFCLLYLLKIIRQQKQLAEVKNDLISNITHEFKTPIATIGIAMEAIQKFNANNDTTKNLRYAKISAQQVNKLNLMVEKLLETATLDSEELKLKLEPHDLVELLRKSSLREAWSVSSKQIAFNSLEEFIMHPIDVFHFENALNNILDNAIKYGGDKISVGIKRTKNQLLISIEDNGNSLTEAHKTLLFEKFYRVPKGNTHDVKGFGIGLYYTKKIIEKHGGTIGLQVSPNTLFKICLPHG